MTIAIYARLSPKPNGDYDGVDGQIKWGREYAAKTWPGEPVEVFADRGISGADAGRDEWLRLREWINAGKVTQVVARAQARLMRDEMEYLLVAKDMAAAGIPKFHTDHDGIVDVEGPVGKIKSIFDADERRRIIKRVNDKLAEKAANGEPPGVKPFGYVHGFIANGEHLSSRCTGSTCGGCKTKTYDVVPEQADVIRWAADRALSGWSLASIAAEMNKPADMRASELVRSAGAYSESWRDGILGVHGGRITPGAVKNWLTVPTIAGLRQHSGEIVGDGNWPAILDRATHRTLKARLTGERAVKRSGGGTYAIGTAHKGFVGRKYLLTGGLAVCGYVHEEGTTCGTPLTGMPIRLRRRKGETTPRVKPYLMCHPKNGGKGHLGIMLPEVEEYVVAEMWRELDRPEFQEALGMAVDHDDERARLVTELSAIEAQRKELAGMWGRRELTTAEWQTAKAELDEQERTMNASLAAIPATSGRIDVDAAREGWGDATLDEQRAFIRRYVAKVTIHPATKMGPGGLDTSRVTIDWA